MWFVLKPHVKNEMQVELRPEAFWKGETVSGSDYFFESDYLGSIRQLTNSSGMLEADYSFDPIGKKAQNWKAWRQIFSMPDITTIQGVAYHLLIQGRTVVTSAVS